MALTQISTDGVKNDAVTAGKIPANAVGSSEISDDAVGADQIADGGVGYAAVAAEAIDEVRLKISNAGTNGQFLQKQSGDVGGLTWAAANEYTHPNHSGEVTSTADGAQVIASNVVDEDNLKISNAGTNGQYLQKQSGNTGGLTWADVTIPPAGNTVDLVADGAIAAGKPCIIKSNGKAAQIGLTSTVVTSPAGTVVSQRYLDAQAVRNYTPRVALDDVNEIMMATYVEESSGEHKCQLFKTNASNSDTLDVVMAEDTIESTDAGTEFEWEDLCFVSSSKFMYVYYHGSYTRAKIGTISGSGTTWSVSWSSAQNIDGVSNSNYGGMKLCKIGTNRVAILCKAKNSNCRWTDDAPGIIIVDITGTNTITYRNYHSPSSQAFSNEAYGSLTYNSTDDLLLASWHRSNSLGRITALKVDSGTSATVTETSGGYTTIENGTYDRNVTTWDSANNKFIHAYACGNLIRTKVITVNSSSLALTVGSAVDYSLGSGVLASKGMAICMSNNNSVYLTYVNNSKNPFQLLDSSFDGSAVSWVHASPSAGIDGYVEGIRQVSLPSTRIMLVFGLDGLSDRGYIYNTKTLNSTTNLSTDKRNFIGFAEDAINDTATGTIKLRGNVVGGQSGLTIGTLYEVQGAGTLNANWQSNSVGLRALSATKGQIIENTGI
jgi:hypothetical protein